MDTAVVVLVLILLLALVTGIGWLLVREAGWERTRLLVIAPFLGITATLPGTSRHSEPGQVASSDDRPALPDDGHQVPATIIDDALRTLREEVHGELVRATGASREFDARLTRIELTFGDARHTPDEIAKSIDDLEARSNQVADTLRRELAMVQRSTSGFGERRVTAVSELYANLARVEAALAAVVNPALLPGEPLSLPLELASDAYIWANWRDVGDRAFTFGSTFNQHRYVLDESTAAAVEQFITALRQALTTAVYPNVQAPNPGASQKAQIRAGLSQIVNELPSIRRKLEAAYRIDMVDDSRPE